MKRKRTRRRQPPNPPSVGRRLDALDEALGACRNIATLGQLLAAVRPGIQAEMQAEAVIHAGRMIATEAHKLAGWIKATGDVRSEP